VKGRSSGRNKAAFANFSGAVWTLINLYLKQKEGKSECFGRNV